VISAGATLVFILLLYLYESFRVAIAILLTTVTAHRRGFSSACG